MSSVFMSFIHEEERVAGAVHIFLGQALDRQVDAFMSSDKDTIYAGEDWMARIFQELKGAKVLLSMLSPVSVTRPWINFEAGAAWMRDIRVIPVCFGGLKVGALPKPYSSLQAVDLETHEGGFYLASSIAHYLGIAKPERPIFSDDLGDLVLPPGLDPEKNKTLFLPYKFLHISLGLFGVQKR